MRRKFVTDEYRKGQEAFKNSKEYEEILQQMEDMNLEMNNELDEIEALIQTLSKAEREELMKRFEMKQEPKQMEQNTRKLIKKDTLTWLSRARRKYEIIFSNVTIVEHDKYVEIVAVTDDNSVRQMRIRGNKNEDLLREQLAEQNIRKTKKIVNR